MFTKNDLIGYLSAKICYNVYDDSTIKPKSKEVKEIAVESWADADLMEFTLLSDKIMGRDIINDYYIRTWGFANSSTTKEGKEAFVGAVCNAGQIEEDLIMEYGEEYYDDTNYSV